MDRTRYDLSHYSFQVGEIGRVQTFAVLPVVAGDSLNVSWSGVFRLSPLRRQLTMDARIDLFGFFIPYRHIYGQTWIDLIRQGVDETQTLPVAQKGNNTHYGRLAYPTQGEAASLPLWLVGGYNRIWHRYFRFPTEPEWSTTQLNAIDPTGHSDANARDYGFSAARLKTIWTTPIDAELDASDQRVGIASNQLDLLALAQTRARLSTERQREFFGQRYSDIMERAFGSPVSEEADQRPYLLGRHQMWMSGWDIEGTDDATLGQYAGKSQSVTSFKLPRRFFPEHGTLWIVGCVRFPTIAEHETHYLISNPNPTYTEISGDPKLWMNQGPRTEDLNDYFATPGNILDGGLAPYGQWYRMHPNIVHRKYVTVQGFPFLDTGESKVTSRNRQRYVDGGRDYDKVFATQSLAHWQSAGRVTVIADRVIPGVKSSIFAGGA